MKAIILNSGVGKRMGTFTANNPKCMVEITNGESILSSQLKLLKRNHITDIILTTGPFASQIEEFVEDKFPDLSIEFVYNAKFVSTNYIYSIFLIPLGFLNTDILLLHGDMIFDERLISGFLADPEVNQVVLEETKELPEKDFKGRVENGLITEIGVNIFGEDCFPLQPLYKFSQDSFKLWYKEINAFIQDGIISVYAEDAFNVVSNQIRLKPYFKDASSVCMEIDNVKDLEKARSLLKRKF